MSEAVFTISADINPVLDERALERQAQLLANQINSIMAKQIEKVSIAPERGEFRPFQQEIQKTGRVLDKLRDGVNSIPRGFSNLARTGRSAFLKFTDLIDVSRRDMVGFGDSIFDTIRNTHRFTEALDGIKAAGSAISDLPQRFEILAAQIQSGTSIVDQFAAKGDRLAQFFQPLQREGEASRVELVELNRSIDQLVAAMSSFSRTATSTGSVIATQFGQPIFNQQIQSMEELLNIVKDSPVVFAKLKGSIDQANATGTLDGIVKELLQIKQAAQVTTGPLGRIAQFINEKSGGKFFKDSTKEARELAIQLEQGAIAKLKEFGAGDILGPIEKTTAALRQLKDGVLAVGRATQTVGRGIATVSTGFLKITGLKSPVDKLVGSFDTLASGLVTKIRSGLQTVAADAGSRTAAIGQSIIFGLGKSLAPLEQVIGAKLNQAAISITKNLSIPFRTGIQDLKVEVTRLGSEVTSGLITGLSRGVVGVENTVSKIKDVMFRGILGLNTSLGAANSFINKNLIDPLKSAGPQILRAFSGIGKDIANGLGSGVESGKTSVFQKIKNLGQGALEALRNVLKSHSDSKETFRTGQDTASGYAHGIQAGQGAVNKAIKGMSAGLGDLANQAAQTFKSIATIAGTVFAGLGAVALKTGADFNVLKQVIGSTLPVLVGSKQAAADLLVEVNKLNDSSPFARSSFLELTRVLAGFGVEAKKITPLIDAIQQTVAATGGSDQDLLELGQAFAKIQSQGRVSADVLQSFSVRGVDAVGVLAKGFNVTTGAMRDMISDGLVPANKAIDVLTTGLKEKFDGATEAVAKNFPGALQRVQARLRDIGGTLLKTFINPAGGGALVDFLNNMADSLSHINKELLPKLAPALEFVGKLLVSFSQQVENVVKSLSGDEFGKFLDSLQPFLPLLAGLAGLAPAAFGWIPIIGPVIAGLGGPFTAAAAAIGVFLAQSGKLDDVVNNISDAFSGAKDTVGGAIDSISGDLGGLGFALTGGVTKVIGFTKSVASVGGFLANGIPFISQFGAVFAKIGGIIGRVIGFFGDLSPVLTKVGALFPKLASTMKFLTGPVGIVISIVTQLILTSQRFRESLGRLFEAIKPVAQVIGQVFVVAIKILDEAIQALEPVFTVIVNILAAVFEALGPVVAKVSEFLSFLQRNDVIEKFFAGVKTAIEDAIKVINGFIDILDKALGPIINLPEIKIDVEMSAKDKALKKAQEDAKKRSEELAAAAKKAGEAIDDNFKKAAKGVETARQAMDNAIDALKQGLESIDQKISPLINAARAVQTTAKAVTDAQQTFADAQKAALKTNNDLTQVFKDQARALADVISPANELAVAQRALTRIQNGLRDSNRELIKLAKERADLLGEEAADDRAGLARTQERATISLNRALQAQLDLENELNNAGKISIDLTGLSLDQIRTRLAGARAISKARGRDREETQQEKDDRRKSASLDVADARQGLKDAGKAQLQFEEDIKTRIQDIDERTLEISDDIADKKLDEQDAQKQINRLRDGENQLAAVTKEFDDKIKDLRGQQVTDTKTIETASKGIATASEAAALAILQFKNQSAIIRGDVAGIATSQQEIWKAQEKGLTFDGPTQTALDAQKGKVGELLKTYKDVTAELQKQNQIQAAGSNLQALQGVVVAAEGAQASLRGGRFVPPALIKAAKENGANALRAVLGSGGAEKGGVPFFPSAAQIEAAIALFNNKFSAVAFADLNIRDIIRDVIKGLGLTAPGFAAAHGYAPGELVHQGMNDGKGLMRMFEFGREAVLPLTRKFDLSRVLSNPHVLPKVLDALPRWSRPAAASISDVAGSATSTNDLASVVRSARSSGGPANSDVYQKKAQREFAGTIGEAVKIAVKEALAESGGIGGPDVDINVMPSTGNEKLIAREVKRAVDKALGKW